MSADKSIIPLESNGEPRRVIEIDKIDLSARDLSISFSIHKKSKRDVVLEINVPEGIRYEFRGVRASYLRVGHSDLSTHFTRLGDSYVCSARQLSSLLNDKLERDPALQVRRYSR